MQFGIQNYFRPGASRESNCISSMLPYLQPVYYVFDLKLQTVTGGERALLGHGHEGLELSEVHRC